jgi:hypothetical protein
MRRNLSNLSRAAQTSRLRFQPPCQYNILFKGKQTQGYVTVRLDAWQTMEANKHTENTTTTHQAVQDNCQYGAAPLCPTEIILYIVTTFRAGSDNMMLHGHSRYNFFLFIMPSFVITVYTINTWQTRPEKKKVVWRCYSNNTVGMIHQNIIHAQTSTEISSSTHLQYKMHVGRHCV